MAGINVQFYNNSSANNVVPKIKNTIGNPIVCSIFEECDILEPTLLLDYNDNIINANYCYIAKFGRYYYITGNTIYDGNKVRLSLKCDALESHWNSFKVSICQAKRSSSNYNEDLEDNTRTYKAQPTYYPITVGEVKFNPDLQGSYVLTVGGK